jgi:hypothetical protein
MPCNTLLGMLPRETFVLILSVFRSPTLRALGNAINELIHGAALPVYGDT